MEGPEISSDDGEEEVSVLEFENEDLMSSEDEITSESSFEERATDIAHKLLERLNQFRKSEMFCDITLKAGDVLIPAHKIVLCACSPYFNSIFSDRFTEKDKDLIVMEEMDGTYLKLVIDYIYTGNLNATYENVRRVLDVANYLQINSAQEICCEILEREIHEDNCLEFMEYANKRSIKSLLKNATKCAARHFYQIVYKDEFSLWDFDVINMFLQEYRSLYDDDMILVAVQKWINHAPKDRLKYLSKLLCFVNPALVSKEFIQQSELLQKNTFCEEWLLESQKSTPSDCYIYFFNRDRDYGIAKVKNASKDSLLRHPLPEKLCQFSIAAHGSIIYVQGGWIPWPTLFKGYPTKSYAYNANKNVWTDFLPLTVPRSNHRSCVLGGSLYSVGGSVNLTSLDTVERLDLITGQYISCNTLQRARSSFGLVSYENFMYVIGGNDKKVFLSSVERYDPREGVWQTMSSKLYSRGESSCSIFEGEIYCLVGRGRAMERFDVKANQWTSVKTMPDKYPREIFTMDNQLFGIFDKEICQYIGKNGQWLTYQNVGPFRDYLPGTGVTVQINK